MIMAVLFEDRGHMDVMPLCPLADGEGLNHPFEPAHVGRRHHM
jgi:hypothetical protein